MVVACGGPGDHVLRDAHRAATHLGAGALDGPPGGGSALRRASRGPTENVHRDCGTPSYGCDGPKFIASESWWNPFAISVCGFHGDVYEDRLVTYDCGGLVFSVDAFSGGRRPQGCVSQR